MLINFYTSRVVLDVLGVEDYGVYNIVGGVVVLFVFLNNVMVTSTQRFLNFSMGKGDQIETSKVFYSALRIHFIIALLIIILAETIGLWFFNKYIVIPEGRVNAARWVYQMSILLTAIQIIRTPYNAAVIAHERMSFYAVVSILESLLKLAAIYLVLLMGRFDHLIAYAFWMMIVGLVVTLIYIIFCRSKFEICRNRYKGESSNYKSLLSFSGWSLLGGAASTGANYGVNIILNIFYGVIVNAAMGVAQQLNSVVVSFSTNMMTAVNPQIVKSYAAGEYDYFIKLVNKSSRFSFLLLFAIALPVLVCCKECLSFWLTNVPDHAVAFCQLIIIYTLIDAIQTPIYVSVQATGKIRNYQILMSCLFLAILPIVYFVLKAGGSPESALVVKVLIMVVIFVVRLLYVRKLYRFPVGKYLKDMSLRCGIPVLIALPIALLLYSKWHDSTIEIICTFVGIFITACLLIIAFGLTNNEKKWFVEQLRAKLSKA